MVIKMIHNIFNRMMAKLISCTVGIAGLETAAGNPAAETVCVVITANILSLIHI